MSNLWGFLQLYVDLKRSKKCEELRKIQHIQVRSQYLIIPKSIMTSKYHCETFRMHLLYKWTSRYYVALEWK